MLVCNTNKLRWQNACHLCTQEISHSCPCLTSASISIRDTGQPSQSRRQPVFTSLVLMIHASHCWQKGVDCELDSSVIFCFFIFSCFFLISGIFFLDLFYIQESSSGMTRVAGFSSVQAFLIQASTWLEDRLQRVEWIIQCQLFTWNDTQWMKSKRGSWLKSQGRV